MCTCKVEECYNKILAKGYCSKHYTQLRKYGKIFKYSYRDRSNHIEIISNNYAEIYLIDKNNEVCGKALIDLEDIDKVKDIKWHKSDLQRNTYYCISNDKKWRRLHRLILGVEDSNVFIDHINHNGLDNRKENLRICTNQQNMCNCVIPKNNTSGCKGVQWSKDKNKWTVQVSVNNKTKYIGRFNNYDDAVKARKEAVKKYYGEFCNEN